MSTIFGALFRTHSTGDANGGDETKTPSPIPPTVPPPSPESPELPTPVATAADNPISRPSEPQSIKAVTEADGIDDLSANFSTLLSTSTPASARIRGGPAVDASGGSISMDFTTSSTLSTPLEISLGSQPRPFIFNRRRATLSEAQDSPSKPRRVSRFGSGLRIVSAPTHLPVPDGAEPESKDVKGGEKVARAANHNEEMVHENMAMSSWRREQIKFTKTARRTEKWEKQVPAQHGPLSLPYARNPSGVDAILPDENAYLSHVFGLRESPLVSNKARTSAIPITSGRVTENESLQSTLGSTHDTKIRSGGEVTTPLVTAPYQHIGIKKAENVNTPEDHETARANTSFLLASPIKTQSAPSSRPSSVAPKAKAKFNDDMLHHYPAHPAASVQHNNAAIMRAQLGLGAPKLTPIPGSPVTERANPFQDQAKDPQPTSGITSADLRSAILRDPQAHSSSRMSYDDLSRLYTAAIQQSRLSYASSAPPPSVAFVNPDGSISSNSRVSSLGSQDSGVSTASSAPKNAPALPSKADKSANWRTKRAGDNGSHTADTPTTNSAVEPITNQPEFAITAATPLGEAAHPRSPREVMLPTMKGGHMTIDRLFAKLGEAEVNDDITINIPTNTDHNSESPVFATARPVRKPVPTPGTGVSSSKSVTTPSPASAKQPLGERFGGVNIETPRSPSKPPVSAKGTPGAGKLLKRGPEGVTPESSKSIVAHRVTEKKQSTGDEEFEGADESNPSVVRK